MSDHATSTPGPRPGPTAGHEPGADPAPGVDDQPLPPDHPVVLAMPRKRVAAGVLFVRDDGAVLLVHPTYKPGWEVPGGLAEVDEPPRAAARREIAEELGLDVAPGRLLAVDWAAPGRLPCDGIMFLYAAEVPDTAAIVLQPEELDRWAWCARADLPRLLPPEKARRVSAALAAAASGTVAELQDGHPVGPEV